MSFENIFTSINTSLSGLIAERTRMEIIANNIANINTTRTPEGGPYKRQAVVFSSVLDETLGKDTAGKGVKVEKIVTDNSKPLQVYDPSHPDADKNGYVSYPNIDITREMVDMMTATRAYEANLSAVKARKTMISESFQILNLKKGKNMSVTSISFEKIKDIAMPDIEDIPSSGKTSGSKSFKNVLGSFINDVNQLQVNADNSIQKLATGEIKDPHQVFIAMNEASIAFDFMVQMRNKLLEAYKQVLALGN